VARQHRQDPLFPQLAKRRNRAAIDRTIAALRQAGRLDGVDASLVAVCRSLAAALDDAPTPYVTATIGRVQLEALRLLTGKPAPEADELDAFLRSIAERPATVRDATDA
jgi:hypothetical protein